MCKYYLFYNLKKKKNKERKTNIQQTNSGTRLKLLHSLLTTQSDGISTKQYSSFLTALLKDFKRNNVTKNRCSKG